MGKNRAMKVGPYMSSMEKIDGQPGDADGDALRMLLAWRDAM